MKRSLFFNIAAGPGLIVLLIMTLSFTSGTLTTAQYLVDEKSSFVKIDGTSTLHDWTATAEEINGSLQAKVEANKLRKIDSAELIFPVYALKTGKQQMDENMYKALKANQYSEIKYELRNHNIHNGKITVRGDLTIAGETKGMETTVIHKASENQIQIKGKKVFKMTDFNVKPPELFLGSLKTGNEITVTFSFTFYQNDNIHN